MVLQKFKVDKNKRRIVEEGVSVEKGGMKRASDSLVIYFDTVGSDSTVCSLCRNSFSCKFLYTSQSAFNIKDKVKVVSESDKR